jgi:hypothetical protein
MKKISLYILLVLIWCHVGLADDIKNFEIEGMRVGESALNYFTKEEIENGKQPQQYPGSDRYIISNIFEHKNFEKYVQIQINYLKDDAEYHMGGILGSSPYDDIKLCLKDKDVMENKMDKFFDVPAKQTATQDKHYDQTGNSKTHITQYFLKNGLVLITCDDWSTKMTNEENLRDIISVNLIGEDFKNFLATEAY